MKHLPRVLVILLTLVMVSSIGVGLTYSKYVGTDTGADQARIAKFGVNVSIAGNGFDTAYSNGNEITVNSSVNTENVLAPGTNGTFGGIKVTGTPEVTVRVTSTATITLNNWTKSGSGFYCPLKVTINGTTLNGLDYSSASAFKAAIKAKIEEGNKTYAPGTNLANQDGLKGDYTWEWPFKNSTGSVSNQNKVYDTYLGDQAASGTAGTFGISVTTTVEQID